METKYIADILFNMSLDMDYADSIENYTENVESLEDEINTLDKDSSLYNSIITIALNNEDMYKWALRKR